MAARNLHLVKRGAVWHAQGRVAYLGRAITGYIRESTGASTRAGGEAWIAERTEREIRKHLVGEKAALSFADVAMLYPATAKEAGFLIPIAAAIGAMPVEEITPEFVRQLAPRLYPRAAADTWHRQVITPIRAVINHAHDLLGPKRVAPIRIKGFSAAERVEQDLARGKGSRRERTPGDWPWLLAFRRHAPPHLGALALFMFATGARISQAVAMHPDLHLDGKTGRACVPAAKGHGDRWITLPGEVMADLAALPRTVPRCWKDEPGNLRLFGFASRTGPMKQWRATCAAAGIAYLPPHSAGRHGFGQQMRVRIGVDDHAAAAYGGWADPATLAEHYNHAEDVEAKILHAFRTGLAQAEAETGIKLLN